MNECVYLRIFPRYEESRWPLDDTFFDIASGAAEVGRASVELPVCIKKHCQRIHVFRHSLSYHHITNSI